MENIIPIQDFKLWIEPIKYHIRQAQIKAAVSVNKELIDLYWFLGETFSKQQTASKWGSGFIDQTSKELKATFPDISGFSTDNLRFMIRFYLFYNQSIANIAQVVQELKSKSNEIHAQAVQETPTHTILNLLRSAPWGYHTLLLRKTKDPREAIFYIQQTVENNWSRTVLEAQFETDLFKRLGKSITNFTIKDHEQRIRFEEIIQI